MRLTPFALFATLASLLGTPAAANDSMAEMKTGGLIYSRSDQVSMEKEVLTISPKEVVVDYLFRNTTDKDVTSLIAFPMPDIDAGPDINVALDDFETDNFLDFTVAQDGKPITPELHQTVIMLGVDQTELLKTLGVPLLPYSDKTLKAIDRLSDADKEKLQETGLVRFDTFDGGEGLGMQTQVTPQWTLKTVYTWTTTFPAGKTVNVVHRYKPSVGGTVTVTFLGNEDYQKEQLDAYRTKYCVDDGFLKAVNGAFKAGTDGVPSHVENWISYVLSTGANWQGPIKDFTLRVDKGDPGAFVSFCGEGVKKTGPTTFEMKATDFYPEKDLDILLVVPVKN